MQAKNKTTQNKINVADFLQNIKDTQQKADCQQICKIMQGVTGQKPAMWGSAIVGFGWQHLVYPSGRELDWFYCGFAPRSGKIAIYFWAPENTEFAQLQKSLGKFKGSGSCINIKTLVDIDVEVLKKMIELTLPKK